MPKMLKVILLLSIAISGCETETYTFGTEHPPDHAYRCKVLDVVTGDTVRLDFDSDPRMVRLWYADQQV
jgi:hypothetical protein